MKLTPVEFEILEIIWPLGSALVRDVHRELYRRKGLAYTTVMTEMNLMYRKGILAHRRRGRAYLYTPRLNRRQALESTLEEFVADFFHGSRESLARFISNSREEPPVQGRPQRKVPKSVKVEFAVSSTPHPPAASHTAVSEEDDVILL